MQPTLSILIISHNQKEQLRRCVESVLAQDLPLEHEIIISDDASTDGTDLIIKEFQSRYPEIIKPVFQKENQYSQGVSIAQAFLYPLVHGEYVALCEGDDYWTDPLKLQKQVEALESHPESDICAHRALRLKRGRFDGWIAPSAGPPLITLTYTAGTLAEAQAATPSLYSEMPHELDELIALIPVEAAP